MGINMRYQKNNKQLINNAVDKMNRNELIVDDILDSEELISEVKNTNSQLSNFLASEKTLKNLLDYIIKEPTIDEEKTGKKFPFNACELLCSDNQTILKYVFGERRQEDEESEKKDENIEIDIYDNNNHINKFENDQELILNNEDNNNEKFNINNIDNDTENEIKSDQDNDKLKRLLEENNEDIVNIEEKEPENKECPFDSKNDKIEENVEKLEKNENIEQNNDNQVMIDTSELSKTQDETTLKEMTDAFKESNIGNNNNFEKTESIEDQEIEEDIAKDDGVDEKDEENDNKNVVYSNESKGNNVEEIIHGSPKKDSLDVSMDKLNTELLDYFFDFLNSDEPLNYVLSGYFAKFFGHLLNNRLKLTMHYLLIQKPHYLPLFTKHLNRKSIVECMFKIIITYSEDISNALEIKTGFIENILKAYNSEDEEVVTNVSDLLIDLFSIRKMYTTIITNKKLFELIYDFIADNMKNDSFKYLIRVLIKVNENILKDFGSAIVTPTFVFNETQELFFNFTYNINNLINNPNSINNEITAEEVNINLYQYFQVIFNKLNSITKLIMTDFVYQESLFHPEYETTFGHINVKMLGLRRVLEIEYIRSIFEILINLYSNKTFTEAFDLNIIIDNIIETSFFKSALVRYFLLVKFIHLRIQ